MPDLPAAARRVSEAAASRAEALDAEGAFPAEDVAELHAAGLLAACVPVALGGQGLGSDRLGSRAALEVLRLVGRGNLSLGRLYEGHMNAWRLIARFGTAGQQRGWAGDARAGLLFAVWNTEAPPGLRLLGRRLAGAKTFATGAGYAARPLVTARDEAGALRMVVAPLTDDGEPGRADLAAWRAMGMRASVSGTFDFGGIELAPGDLLGEPGDYTRQPDFSAGAWRFAAVHLGGIEALAEAARAHLRRTGRGDDPYQKARLGQTALGVETARLWLERAALMAGDPEAEPEAVMAYVNLARLAVERAGLDVLELSHRSVGVQGFLRPHPVERLTRDLSTYLRQPNPDGALAAAAGFVLGSGRAMGELWPRP